MTRFVSPSSQVLRFLRRRIVRDILIASALALIAALVWCWFYYRLSTAHWKEPVTLGGDGVFFMTCLQAVAEGDFTPWLLKAPARLGAPFISEWNSFPITEQFLFWTFGQISKVTGLPVAVSLMMVTAHALAAAAFYGACRLLGKRRLFSAVFALLFALSYYIFQRGLGHVTIAYCWHVPLCWAVICFSFSKRGVFKNRRRTIIALVVAAITGLQNPYHMFVFVQFLGIAFLLQLMRRRPWRVVWAPVGVAFVTAAFFLSMQSNTLVDRYVNHRGNLSTQRSYSDMEFYALKPVDLLLPLQWEVPGLTDAAAIYNRSKIIRSEFPMGFIGVTGLLGALIMTGIMLRDLLVRGGKLSKWAQEYAVPSLWIVAVTMVGGVIAIGALVTSSYFLRGSNRFSVYIALMMTFFLVDIFTAWTRRWRWWGRCALLLVPVLAASGELWAMRLPERGVVGAGPLWNNYGDFITEIEKSVGRDAMLFNLPAVDFPESFPRIHEDIYAPLLLYVAKKSSLRFSYGDMRNGFRDTWQKTCANLPADQMVAQLRRYGFRGVVVSRWAYPKDGEDLLTSLSAVTGTPAINTERENLAFIPFPPPWPNDKTAALPPTSNISLDDGWWPIEEIETGESLLWGSGNSTIALYRDPALPPAVPSIVNLSLSTPTDRTLYLNCRGQTLLRLVMRANAPYPLESLQLPLKPGWNALHLRTDQPPLLRKDQPKDWRFVTVLARDLVASGLSPRSSGGPVAPTPILASTDIDPATRASAHDVGVAEFSDKTERRWREFHGVETDPLIGTGGQPVRRAEFLPSGRPFCLVMQVTPGPKEGNYATLLSCLTQDYHGFSLERGPGANDSFTCYVGDGHHYLTASKGMQLLPGHSYLVALNVDGITMTVRIRGDGLNETIQVGGEEARLMDSNFWCFGNWLFDGRPFAGRIELLSMGDPPPPVRIEALLDSLQERMVPPIKLPKPSPVQTPTAVP